MLVGMSEETLWEKQSRTNPSQAQDYIERFAQLRAEGADLHGEARFVDALLPRGARVLDAGCGTGRVGGELAARSHVVTGVDLDGELLAQARRDYPGSRWELGDLATLGLRDVDGNPELFDVVVAAGNVLAFVAPGSTGAVLRSLAEHLATDGRLVVGFSLRKGYALGDFEADAAAAGLAFTARFAGWDMHLFDADSDFIVALLHRARPVN